MPLVELRDIYEKKILKYSESSKVYLIWTYYRKGACRTNSPSFFSFFVCVCVSPNCPLVMSLHFQVVHSPVVSCTKRNLFPCLFMLWAVCKCLFPYHVVIATCFPLFSYAEHSANAYSLIHLQMPFLVISCFEDRFLQDFSPVFFHHHLLSHWLLTQCKRHTSLLLSLLFFPC